MASPGGKLAQTPYVSLATFRKDGTEVRTPVWIAADGDHLYVYTNVTSGKVKRIRGNGRARLAPATMRGDVLGEWEEARARLVEDPGEKQRGFRALLRKYGWQMRLALLLSRLSGRYEERAILGFTLTGSGGSSDKRGASAS